MILNLRSPPLALHGGKPLSLGLWTPKNILRDTGHCVARSIVVRYQTKGVPKLALPLRADLCACEGQSLALGFLIYNPGENSTRLSGECVDSLEPCTKCRARGLLLYCANAQPARTWFIVMNGWMY